MNKSSKKFFILLLVFFFFAIPIFAQDAVNKALDLINKSLILGDYDKAYSYAKFVVNFYDGEEIPSDVQNTVYEAIGERGNYLVSVEKWNDVLVMEDEIKNYPSNIKKALEPSVQKTREHFKRIEEEKEKVRLEEERRIAEQKRLEEEARIKAEKEAETKRLIELYEQQKKEEQERLIQQQKEEQEKLLAQQKLEQEKIAQQQKLEEEKLAIEKTLEEERLAREKELEQERLAQLKKLEEERLIQLQKFEEEKLAQQQRFEEERLELQAKLEQDLKLQQQKMEAERNAVFQNFEEQKRDYSANQSSNNTNAVVTENKTASEEVYYEPVVLSPEDQQEFEKIKQESEQNYREEISALLSEINEANNNALKNISKNNKIVIIILFIIILIFIGAFAIVIFLWFKQSKIQQAQMKDTLMAMQAQSTNNVTATAKLEVFSLMLQMPTLTSGLESLENKSAFKSLENKSNSVSGYENEKSEIISLINECRKYGKQIDEITGRKNVSTRVADLVVKISQYLGYSEYDCIIFYAASLVYDIGFLGTDTSLFKSGTLTESQFKQIQAHAGLGEKMLFFVNQKYRQTFNDAVGKHHENLDGTGYPNGLMNNEIPYIARVLRVAESYIALVSNRSYKNIKDRDAAIAELRNSPNHYDKKIVDALDSII